ncbi:MAG: STAS-like domain-containing protein [Gammaproteobacteria bacterium]|nr:STAS-like domain-containing protein [Gammaproteobacteria bacterium]
MNPSKHITISIARNFSKYPAGRYRTDGKASGEAFRDDHLVPALRKGDIVSVVFDDVAGCGSSFLDEAFGGLVRSAGMDKAFLDAHLKLVTNDSGLDDFVRLTQRYIEQAAEETAVGVA